MDDLRHAKQLFLFLCNDHLGTFRPPCTSPAPCVITMLALASSAPLSLVVQRAMPATARLATPRMAEFVETDAAVLDRYMNLPHPGQVQAEYLTVDRRKGAARAS